MNMDDCSNHRKDLFGESDMKVVAEAIGDLHYQTLANLLFELHKKLRKDSSNDTMAGRLSLGHQLHCASNEISNAYYYIDHALTPIQKAKDIIVAFLGAEKVEGFTEAYINTWLAAPQAAALLSGEDWKESQWEYKVRPSLADWDLTDMGKQGWQLCAVNDKYYYFKRPLPEPPKP